MWQVVGVPEPEAAVYESLVHHGQATVSELGGELRLSRDRATRLLSGLVERGMVTRLSGRPARYTAVTPDLAAAALIADWERAVHRLRTRARELTVAGRERSVGHPAELVEVVEGAGNVRQAFFRVQHSARRSVRVFDRPPYTAAQPPEGNADEYQLLAEGTVEYRTLYDQQALAIPGRMTEIWNGIRHGERARVAGALPMKMALCDDALALIPVSSGDRGAGDAAYLVHPSSLLDALSELFEAIWDRSIPLNRGADAGVGDLADGDAELLGLLAAGATDESIARTLGWSVRTVHRHLRRLGELVGAGTRFQIGMEAVRRGWV